jgi:hypothetical protein
MRLIEIGARGTALALSRLPPRWLSRAFARGRRLAGPEPVERGEHLQQALE